MGCVYAGVVLKICSPNRERHVALAFSKLGNGRIPGVSTIFQQRWRDEMRGETMKFYARSALFAALLAMPNWSFGQQQPSPPGRSEGCCCPKLQYCIARRGEKRA